jgi:hypothetical protein
MSLDRALSRRPMTTSSVSTQPDDVVVTVIRRTLLTPAPVARPQPSTQDKRQADPVPTRRQVATGQASGHPKAPRCPLRRRCLRQHARLPICLQVCRRDTRDQLIMLQTATQTVIYTQTVPTWMWEPVSNGHTRHTRDVHARAQVLGADIDMYHHSLGLVGHAREIVRY